MSFQDVGMRGSKRQTVNAAMQQQGNTSSSIPQPGNGTTTVPSSSSGPSAWGSLSIPASTAMTQISESLTQYQRNVGILEKISHALLTNTTAGSAVVGRAELEQQYKAQSDVLRELEQRLREQILGQRQRLATSGESSPLRQALLKLERDFERVQASVQATKARVARQMKQYQQRGGGGGGTTTSGGAGFGGGNNNNNNQSATILQQQQEQIQLQLQQDRLNEEIMREREEEIRKINKGMHQVNEIYKDLAHIVGQQQEQVDQIEDKMEDARNTAQSGLDHVHQANEKYGKGSQCVIS